MNWAYERPGDCKCVSHEFCCFSFSLHEARKEGRTKRERERRVRFTTCFWAAVVNEFAKSKRPSKRLNGKRSAICVQWGEKGQRIERKRERENWSQFAPMAKWSQCVSLLALGVLLVFVSAAEVCSANVERREKRNLTYTMSEWWCNGLSDLCSLENEGRKEKVQLIDQ